MVLFCVFVQGQIESKRSSKKDRADTDLLQTKGTAMSFGFRKNLNTTPKKLRKFMRGENELRKKADKCNNNNNSITNEVMTIINRKAKFHKNTDTLNNNRSSSLSNEKTIITSPKCPPTTARSAATSADTESSKDSNHDGKTKQNNLNNNSKHNVENSKKIDDNGNSGKFSASS